MIIVESQNEKEQFLDYWNNEESVIIPIFSDLERHPINNGLSFLYVRFPNLDFILPFNHNDCENLKIDLSTSNKNKWCWDKKSLLQMDLGINKLKDVQTALFFMDNKIYSNSIFMPIKVFKGYKIINKINIKKITFIPKVREKLKIKLR